MRFRKGTKFLPRMSTTWCAVRLCRDVRNCKACDCQKCRVEAGYSPEASFLDFNLGEYAASFAGTAEHDEWPDGSIGPGSGTNL